MNGTSSSRFLINGKLSSSALPLAVTAEKVEFAIENLLKHGELLDRSRELPALKRARDFLEDVKLGRELVRDTRLHSRAVEASDAYGEALDVFSQLLTADRRQVEDRDLDPILDDYLQTLNDLVGSLEGPPTQLDRIRLEGLRKFFQVLRKVTFDKLSVPPERVVISSAG